MIEILKVIPCSPVFEDFLNLPKTLYAANYLTQVYEEEKQQLLGEHPLSHYYTFQGFVAYQDGVAKARLATISYPEESALYIGYFESFECEVVVSTLFEYVKEEALKLGKERVVGPVNASFWLGYRMKRDNFEIPVFTGEPNALSYYPSLWIANGFSEIHHYRSVMYKQVPLNAKQNRIKKRYNQCLAKGYEIVSPKAKEWGKVSVEVFELLSKLYADFPLFHQITQDEFVNLFDNYKYILDFSMVKLAYLNNCLVGFLITVPDYGNLVYRKLSLWNLLKILKIKKRAKRYLIMYLGVDSKHLGLGSALAYPIYKAIQKRKAQAVGALIYKGKITENYISELQDDYREYSLFEVKLD